MECRHIILRIVAGVIAGLGPDGVAAPAVVYFVFTQVVSPKGYPFFPEHLFRNIGHDAGVPVPVGASVDDQHIEGYSIVGERDQFPLVDKFPGRAMAIGASFGRFLPGENKSADRAFPSDRAIMGGRL